MGGPQARLAGKIGPAKVGRHRREVTAQLLTGESSVKLLSILFVSPYLPSLIRVRSYNLIKALAERGNQVTLLALEPPGDDRNGLESLHGWCRRVETVPLARWRTLWNGLSALPSQVPLQAAYSRSPQMSALIRQMLGETEFDVVHVEHLRGAELGQAVNGTPVVFDSVDSITFLFEQTRRLGPTWRSRLMAGLDLERTRRFESHLLERYARVLICSPRDRDFLLEFSAREDSDGRLVVLPSGVDLRYFSPLDTVRDPATLIFTGKMSYHANLAAALDLIHQVMPHVWAFRSDARLVIAGKDPTKELLAQAADPRITVTGTVPDLRPYLAQATIAVSPIRYSAGIQLKLLEAMGMATPVVSTPQATAVLQIQPGRDLLVADTPQAFAEAVITLLADEGRRQRVGQAGRRYVETYHDWSRIAEKLEAVYRDAMAEYYMQAKSWR
jgi:glycosyltransferase involved in cell wall biosynthesis